MARSLRLPPCTRNGVAMGTKDLIGVALLGLGILGARPARAAEKYGWTVMLYQVGEHKDAGLEEVQIDVARAIAKANPGAGVKVVLQSDRSKHTAKSNDAFYYDRKYTGIERFELVAGTEKPWKSRGRLATENAADPKTLYDFMVWTATRYPAENYALLIDGHGSGVISFNGPGSARDPKNAGVVAPYATRPAPGALSSLDGGGGLFGMGGAEPGLQQDGTFVEDDGSVSNFIGVGVDDDTGTTWSSDDLSWTELERVFKDFQAYAGVRLGVLGLYNCYGGNIEGMYQLRDAVQYVCASPTTEKFSTVDGHDPFVSVLSADPRTTPREAAKTLVGRFADDAVRNGTSEIKFAWDMTKIATVVGSVSALGALLRTEYARGGFSYQLSALIEYSDDGYYWDIRSIAQALLDDKYSAKDASNQAALKAAAQKVKDDLYAAWPAGWYTGDHRFAEPSSWRHLFVNRKMQTLGGLSIYWPNKDLRDKYIGDGTRSERSFYKALDFARDTQWDELLDVYLGAPAAPAAPAARGSI